MTERQEHFMPADPSLELPTEIEVTPQSEDVTLEEESGLPIERYQAEIREHIREHDSTVLIGETGSGKTTKVGGYLLDEFPDAKICITQPRVIAATSVAEYVAEQRGERVGGEVGYNTRFEKALSRETRLNFSTDGVLLAKFRNDPLLMEYDIVVVDEAHERSLNIDFTLGLLKLAQAEREKQGLAPLKVVAMSATIEKEKFTEYFGGESEAIEVPGRLYPVETHYEPEPVSDYVAKAAEKVEEIVMGGGEGDILIFMPGEGEIKETIRKIEDLKIEGLDVMPLYGTISPQEQKRALRPSRGRKVIVATNIAETSITIDGVCFVIDSGFIKQKNYDPGSGIDSLAPVEHAKSGCEQRKGRAGRTQPGVCYRLYTEEEFLERSDFQKPEIMRSNLDQVILQAKRIGGFADDIEHFPFIDRPSDEAFRDGIESLQSLGALDEEQHLTEAGERMSEFPLSPERARMLIDAEKFGCVDSMASILAMMGDKSVFYRPSEKEPERQREADRMHAKFKGSGSDFLTLLHVWLSWESTGFDKQWANEHYLNVRQLFEAKKARAQLLQILRDQGVAAENETDDPTVIEKCIVAGQAKYIMEKAGRFSYMSSTGKLPGEFFIHPSSAHFNHASRNMIGSDVMTSVQRDGSEKTYARRCQRVELDWLPEVAPQLLETVTEGDGETRYDAESDVVQTTVAYRFKGRRYGTPIVRKEEAKGDEAVSAFVDAILSGRVQHELFEKNERVINQLQQLYFRSGSSFTFPDVHAWYEERLEGAASLKEALRSPERLQMSIDDFLTQAEREKLERDFPETLQISGHSVSVQYEDRMRAGTRTVEATILVPFELGLALSEEDIPKWNPALSVKIALATDVGRTFESLTKFQEYLRAERDKHTWNAFTPPIHETPTLVSGEELPSLESLGAVPVAYGKSEDGKDMIAYPAWERTWHRDSTTYEIKYFPNKKDAEYADKTARATKLQNDEYAERRVREENARKERDLLAKSIGKQVFELTLNARRYGLTDAEAREVIRDFTSASDSYDYARSLDTLRAIAERLLSSDQEREKRLLLIPETQALLGELRERVGAITELNYKDYGLNKAAFTSIQERWSRACRALEFETARGDLLMPDPEGAAKLIDELGSELASLTVIPKEERERMKNMMTEELRGEFTEQLSLALGVLRIVNAVPDDVIGKHGIEKMQKIKTRLADARREINGFLKELPTIDSAERARSKRVELEASVDRIARDLARLTNGDEGWTKSFREMMSYVPQIASGLEVELSEEQVTTIQKRVAEMAQKKELPPDIEVALEELIIEIL